jgi:hypothetical protein
MNFERFGHTATLLDDGKVLVMGGSRIAMENNIGVIYPVISTEIYDPALDKWTVGPNLPDSRSFHTATKAGVILIYGGAGSSNTNSYLTCDSGGKCVAPQPTVMLGSVNSVLSGGSYGGPNPVALGGGGFLLFPFGYYFDGANWIDTFMVGGYHSTRPGTINTGPLMRLPDGNAITSRGMVFNYQTLSYSNNGADCAWVDSSAKATALTNPYKILYVGGTFGCLQDNLSKTAKEIGYEAPNKKSNSMALNVNGHQVNLLKNGSVLITGGGTYYQATLTIGPARADAYLYWE